MPAVETAPPSKPCPAPQPRNWLGACGFLLSLIGVLGLASLTVCLWAEFPPVTKLPPWGKLAFGALCPLGLLLSAGAVFRLPKQLATAGIVFGLVGSLWLSSVGVLLVADAMALFSNPEDIARQREADAIAAVKAAVELVKAEEARHGGVALSDDVGQQLIAGQLDGWEKPLIYQRISNDDFEIISAGPDKEYGSDDDISSRTVDQGRFGGNPDGF